MFSKPAIKEALKFSACIPWEVSLSSQIRKGSALEVSTDTDFGLVFFYFNQENHFLPYMLVPQ